MYGIAGICWKLIQLIVETIYLEQTVHQDFMIDNDNYFFINSIGIVSHNDCTFEEGITLESGKKLAPLIIRYETYGVLNSKRDNAILILHAFSGDAHAAGYTTKSDKYPGWWDMMIGPNKAFDTNRYYVICSNVIGGCSGSSGPATINPATGKPYGITFPVITIKDMVKAQELLLDYLGIDKLLAVSGGSMGGMQALKWAAISPERVTSAMIMASTPRLSPQGIAFNAVGRNAITSDPDWMEGQYYEFQRIPRKGLSIARMIGHITYLSDESMGMKFGRKLRNRDTYGYDFEDLFQVESYLQYQGEKFVKKFDANSYIYLTKAMDYFSLGESSKDFTLAFFRSPVRFLFVTYSSDWLYPTNQTKEFVYALMDGGVDVSFIEIESPFGHDSFLLESQKQTQLIKAFLESL